jgi:hypothetical protein
VVESSGLLNRRRVKNSTGGSNPPLSAIFSRSCKLHQSTPNPLPAERAWRAGTFTALHLNSRILTAE